MDRWAHGVVQPPACNESSREGSRLLSLASMARKPNRPSPEEILVALFDAEHAVRRFHEELRHVDRAQLLRTMAGAVAASLREQNERDAVVQQTCLAQILGQLTGDAAVDLLIDLFGSEHPEPQQIAGEALEQLAFDRFKEVALGIERALVRLPQSSPCLLYTSDAADE